MYFDKFNIKSNQQHIFQGLHCENGTDSYPVFLEAYKTVEANVIKKIKGQAILQFGTIPKEFCAEEKEKKALYVLFTLGKQVTTYVDLLFAENNYVQGLVVDAIADDYLFQMDRELQKEIKKICISRKLHIVRRLEAPTHIPMEIQKVAYDICNAKNELNLEINESYMFDPIKTLCLVFEVREGVGEFALDHDCRKCDKMDCQKRDANFVPIHVLNKGKTEEVRCQGGETLLDTLRRNEMYLPAECAGKGTCGKCKIRVLEGNLEVTEADELFFTNHELEQGYRLACQAYPNCSCKILVEENEESMEILSSCIEEEDLLDGEYGIAIDIGTTTLAMGLVDLTHGKVVDHYTGVNHQRTYGTDVITRIQASNNGKHKELQNVILNDLYFGIQLLTNSFKKKIKQVIIAGNTTMIHLLMGYSCKGMGEFPYTPKTLDPINISGYALFEQIGYEKEYYKKIDFPVSIFPGISTFVGGDIVSGLYYLNFFAKEKTNILIDLGTNGELVIGNKNRCFATSVAAGPAFEGGNLSSGVASVDGAICKIDIEKYILFKTIHDKPPIGICGTGMIDGIAELLKQGFIDDTGLFMDPYFENGYIVTKDVNNKEIKITQKDIREIQLAKAAVAAGIEIMIEEYGTSKNKIGNIYVAGGFGFQLDIKKAKKVGILPTVDEMKYEMIGNSSLLGGIKFLQCLGNKEIEIEMEKIKKLRDKIIDFNLANTTKFNEVYMKHMYFDI